MPRLIDGGLCPHCGGELPDPKPRVCPGCMGSLQQRHLRVGCFSAAPVLLLALGWLYGLLAEDGPGPAPPLEDASAGRSPFPPRDGPPESP